MPEFKTESDSLESYIVKTSKIPATVQRTQTTKPVFVYIIIEKDGSVTFDKIGRGYNVEYDNEAKRIVEEMPAWSPGRLGNGEPARLSMIIPFWFQ